MVLVEGVDLVGLVGESGLDLFEAVGFLAELFDVERVDLARAEQPDGVAVTDVAGRPTPLASGWLM